MGDVVAIGSRQPEPEPWIHHAIDYAINAELIAYKGDGTDTVLPTLVGLEVLSILVTLVESHHGELFLQSVLDKIHQMRERDAAIDKVKGRFLREWEGE